MCLENNNYNKNNNTSVCGNHTMFVWFHILIHLNFHYNLVKKVLLSHFINEEIESQRLSGITHSTLVAKLRFIARDSGPGAVRSHRLLCFPKKGDFTE